MVRLEEFIVEMILKNDSSVTVITVQREFRLQFEIPRYNYVPASRSKDYLNSGLKSVE